MSTGDLLKEARVEKRAPSEKTRTKDDPPDLRIVSPQEDSVGQTDQLADLETRNPETTGTAGVPPASKSTTQKASTSGAPQLGERYEVLSVIGKGGMGSVYKVLDHELGKTLAIKVLQAELANDQTALRRFEQEAEAASQLEHHSLVSVFGHGKTSDGAPYLVMDYLEGESLSNLLEEKGVLESERALNLFHQICEGLVHAHEKGVIHRDIKPANIIVSKTESGVENARIVDFGIAKILPVSNRETHDLTETRQVFGSPHYMSPEHCLGFKMDARSDIYSLGCLMYEVLTGKPPFSESDAIQVVIKHINEEAKPFSRDVADDPIKMKLEGVVLKCLEKDQLDRYQNVEEVLKDIELIQAGKAPSKFVRRKAAKLEYTSSQIVRAIVATFLLLTYIGCARGWFGPLEYMHQSFGLGMFLICIGSAWLFSTASLDQYRKITEGKNSRNDWWSMIFTVSATVMCLTFLPCAIAISITWYRFESLTLDYGWLSDFCSAISLVHLLSIGSVFVAIVGRMLFRAAKKTQSYLVGFQYIAVTVLLMLIAGGVFPAPSSDFTRYLSTAGIIQKYAPDSREDLLNLSLQLNPLNQAALFDLIDMKLAQRDQSAVDALFNAYFERETASKKLAAAHFKRAETMDRNWLQMEELTEAIKCHPRYDYYERRAQVHFARGDFKDALKDYEEAIRSNPNSPVGYIGRAQIYAATYNFPIALMELDGIAKNRSGWANIDVFFLRALLCDRVDRHQLAMNDYHTVVELAKTKHSFSPYEALKVAYSYRQIGDMPNAQKYLEMAGVTKDPRIRAKFNKEIMKLHLPLKWIDPEAIRQFTN